VEFTIGKPVDALGALDFDRGAIAEARHRVGEDRPKILV
jgi:hypothetical protein